MKTTWNTSPIIKSWYNSVLDITRSIRPHLFTRTRKGIRRPTPVSQSARFRKEDIPLPAPDFNPSAASLPLPQAKELRVLLFAMHNDFSEGTATITSDDFMVVLDSGCTCAISFDKKDFVGSIRPVQFVELKGIASGLRVQGIGQVHWTFLNEHSQRITIPITCLYVPEAPTRLLPPQQLSEQNGTSTMNGAWIGHGQDALIFYQGHCIRFPYNESSNLPIAKLAPGIQRFQAFNVAIDDSSDHETQRTDNLSPASRKLLRLHHRLGHKGFHDLQKWAAEGINGIPTDVATCQIPMCRACQYGAAKKRSHEKTNTGSVVGAPQGPGDFVSVDQMIAGSPGLIPFESGRPSPRRYKAVTMWVDHFSRFLHAQCHEQATIQAALESKENFELYAKRYNVRIRL